jgi:hypothetical protein
MTTTTRERRLLLPAPMVAAVRDGSKTQHRAPIGRFPNCDTVFVDYGDGWWPYKSCDGESFDDGDGNEVPMRCPFGAPGDRLWIPETWGLESTAEMNLFVGRTEPPGTPLSGDADLLAREHAPMRVVYRADGDIEGMYWRPAQHAPRWAARTVVEIDSVRVEQADGEWAWLVCCK